MFVDCSDVTFMDTAGFHVLVDATECHAGAPVLCGGTIDANMRWSRFAPCFRDAGFASVSALPMRLRTEVIGVLNLFSSTPGPLGPEDQMVAQALGDIATIGILQGRGLHDAHIVTQLERALESRIVLEQAKGIVAERAHVSIDAASHCCAAWPVVTIAG